MKEEEVDKNSGKSLEECVKTGKVQRRSGETTAMLTQGEANLIWGKGGKTLQSLTRRTNAKISIFGGRKNTLFEETGELSIKGSRSEVQDAEVRISQVLSGGTYTEITLDRSEIICLVGKHGVNIRAIQDQTKALIHHPPKGSKSMNVM